MQRSSLLRFVLMFVLLGSVFGGVAFGQELGDESPNAQQPALGLDVIITDFGSNYLGRPVRNLSQMLVPEDKVERLRESLQKSGHYGMMTVDQLPSDGTLPYTDSLINHLVIGNPINQPFVVNQSFVVNQQLIQEAARTICPGGILTILTKADDTAKIVDQINACDQKWAPPELVFFSPDDKDAIVVTQKLLPTEMDSWTHRRHDASGNSVSDDQLVGPPRHVRWVTGPSVEIGNTVVGGGQNYYGGLWARNSYNGLKLWEKKISPSAAQGGYGYTRVPGSVGSVALDDGLLVCDNGVCRKLRAEDGAAVQEYPAAGKPEVMLVDDGTLYVNDATSIRAVDLKTGDLLWKHDTTNPQYLVVGDGSAYFIQGDTRRGDDLAAVALDTKTGKVRWSRPDFPWIAKVKRMVCQPEILAFEISTYNNDGPGNYIQLVSTDDGSPLWDHEFVPGMAHVKQARPMFVGDDVWVLDDRKCSQIDVESGEVVAEYPAGWGHCFPPVATTNYLFSGEMDLVDLESGELDANRITKGACGRDAGWIPANGLINVTPKHCTCWPMLRGYAALAPALENEPVYDLKPGDYFVQSAGYCPEFAGPKNDYADQWPCYRQNSWRSSATTASIGTDLTEAWSRDIAQWPTPEEAGPIREDWIENPFARGPVTAPVIADGMVVVACTDEHRVVAMDTETSAIAWSVTVNGRVDTPPTLYNGLCLFGTSSGWVYALRLGDGELVWRLRATPTEQRIVAYGQIESPWPIAGSPIVIDGLLYFAAGRQALADGGVFIFAVTPTDGTVQWVSRINTLPMTNFYANVGLEYDNIDLLCREGDGNSIAMSRWVLDRQTGAVDCKAKDAFTRVAMDDGTEVVVPRGTWSYAPRNQPRVKPDSIPRRPLIAYQGDSVWGSSEDKRTLYRRDYSADSVGQFDLTWITGWEAGKRASAKTEPWWRSQRMMEQTAWTVDLFGEAEPTQKIAAVLLAGDRLYIAGSEGGVYIADAKTGERLTKIDTPKPVWDGLAIAEGRLWLTTAAGKLICLSTK